MRNATQSATGVRTTAAASRTRVGDDRADRGLFCRRLSQFRVDGDRNFISHDSGSTVHPKILPCDFCGCRGTDALVTPRIFDGGGGSVHIEHNLLRHAVDRQVARELKFSRPDYLHLLRMKGNGWILLHVEEVRAT